MQIYEVSNPSDPITMAAEIDAVAACAPTQKADATHVGWSLVA